MHPRGRQGPSLIGPMDGPQQQQDGRPTPDEPGHIPGQKRPRREQGEHPGRVDIGQEWPGRVVGIATAEPQANSRPIGSRVGAGRLAAGDQPGGEDSPDQDQDRHRCDPPRVVQPRNLAPDGPPEDACATPRRPVDQPRQLGGPPRNGALPARAGWGGSRLLRRIAVSMGHGCRIVPPARPPASSGYSLETLLEASAR